MTEQQLRILRTNAEVAQLIEYLQDKDFVTVDTETTGVSPGSEIIGYSLCAEPNIAYYVITAYWDVETKNLKYLETRETAAKVMHTLAQKCLIMHNGVFDCAMIERNYGVSLIKSLHTDTMILAHILDENRQVGLKELGTAYYGASAKKEQKEMHDSVTANGGTLTKTQYELYKADADLIAKYGAKDAILTYNLFYEMVPQLYQDGLGKFFYEDESMPMIKGPTYDLNTTGLRVDTAKMKDLQKSLEVEILELKEFVYSEIKPYIEDKYPGTNKKNTFNINSGAQISWLLFEKLRETPPKVSNAGQELALAMGLSTPYKKQDKEDFINLIKSGYGEVWRDAGTVWDKAARRFKGQAKIKEYWNYLSTDKTVIAKFASKYKWVEKLQKHKKLTKMLNTYVQGILEKTHYGIIYPSFLQHGTTSGRYSSKNPNFQNLPRDDKRIKECIIARPGKVFVGADYEQLEPRIFASFSKDARLIECFRSGQDFYSVIGMDTFDKSDCVPKKEGSNAFGVKYKQLRDVAKVVALSAAYGTTANKMAITLDKSREEAREVIDKYFQAYPSVKELMLESHEKVKSTGKVYNLFGRPRRLPEALKIREIYGDIEHENLPYQIRNILNLSMNHRIQSTGASITNRASIAFCNERDRRAKSNPLWAETKLVINTHDEIIIETSEIFAEDVKKLLKNCMENTVTLPQVALIANPVIASNIAKLK